MPAHLVRRSVHRPAFRPIAALVLALLAGKAARAVDIPFDNGTVIDSTTNRGFATAFADIDGDGDLDLLSAVSTPNNSVSWWENVNGSFGTPQSEHVIMATWTGATSVAAGDVDGDGDLDVLAAAFDLGDIVVFRNDGGGTSWSALDVDLAVPGPRQAVFADLDRDGDLDVVGAINGITTTDVSWWENTAGDGSAWTRRVIDSTMSGARSVAVGDVDGDGDLDVVASAEFDDKVVLYRNTAGTWPETQINTALFDGGSTLTLADVDGDGDLDAAGVAEEAGTVVFWRNSAGDGSSWSEVAVGALGGAYGIASGDIDADGDVDLVTAGRSSLRIDWWENTASDGSAWTGRLIESFAVGSNGRSVAVGDADGDGLLDIAASLDSRLELYHNDSIHHSLTFPGRQDVDAASPGATAVTAADIDADGDLDLVGAAQFDDAVTFYENVGGDGASFAPTLVATLDGAQATAAGDVDRDGAIDLVGAGSSGLSYWRNASGDGSSWPATTIDAGFPDARDIELADIDGDGDLDVVATSFVGDEVAFYRNANGNGSVWQKLTPGTFFVDAASVAVGDVDGDGDLDLVAAATADDDVSWFENLGTGDGSSWTEHPIATALDGASSVALGDVDGDGDLDVVATAENADTVVWFENAASTFTEHAIGSDLFGARGAAVADLDADGYLDVVATAAADQVVRVYRNLAGTGLSWGLRDVVDTAFDGPAGVAIADVDGDGRLDVAAAAASGAGTVALFRNGGGQAALATTNISPGSLGNGVTQALLRIQLLHRGQPGETPVELASLRFRFEDAGQDALSSAEANGIIDHLRLYLDDGNNTFDGGDVLVHTESTLALTGGAQTLSLADGDVNLGVSQGTSKTYFVVVQTTVDYTSQALGFFRLIHLNGESVTEDRANDSVLRLEQQPDVATNLFQVNPTADSADLVLQSIGESADPVIAGNTLTYTVTVRNNGPSAAQNVAVATTLPSNTTFLSTSGCLNDPNGGPTCNLGTLADDATSIFTLTVRVSPASCEPLFAFAAHVSSTTAEAAPGDEVESVSTGVVCSSDLALDLSQPPRDYVDNAPIRYLIQISNTGPSDSTAATVTDTFPAILTGVTWTCSGTGGSTCPASGNGNLAAVAISVPAGQSLTFVATGHVPDNTTTPIVNTATVSDDNDPDGSDNTDSVTSPWSNPIFLDGFESGSFSAWSAHVP